MLIVDDDELVLTMMKRAMKGAVDKVLTAGSAQRAVELLGDEIDRLDILLTDVSMPGMSGPELADLATARHPDLRVVFISGFLKAEHERMMPKDYRLLTKPFTPTELRKFVLD